MGRFASADRRMDVADEEKSLRSLSRQPDRAARPQLGEIEIPTPRPDRAEGRAAPVLRCQPDTADTRLQWETHARRDDERVPLDREFPAERLRKPTAERAERAEEDEPGSLDADVQDVHTQRVAWYSAFHGERPCHLIDLFDRQLLERNAARELLVRFVARLELDDTARRHARCWLGVRIQGGAAPVPCNPDLSRHSALLYRCFCRRTVTLNDGNAAVERSSQR